MSEVPTECDICGKPGTLRHYPAPVPCSGGFCDDCYEFLQRGYDPTVAAEYRYLTGPTERFDTYAEVVAFYEFHGEWCVRQIEQFEGRTVRSERNGDWASVCESPLRDIDLNHADFPLTELAKEDFERLWRIAEPDVRD